VDAARKTADRVARESYGRLVALLAARSRDLAGAEDALSEALVSALRVWPERGIPANPDAWLLAAARNRLSNRMRHREVMQAAEPALAVLAEERADEAGAFPDERLKLLFVCAHPAIDATLRAPLMLQTILGLDAERIGKAFLVPAATMGQRLVRAKAKIRDARLRFETPEPEDMPERLSEVLDAIYAAYGVGWDGLPDMQASQRPAEQSLTEEAIYLCRLLVALLPGQAEPKGLLALMLYCEARRAARYAPDGSFVPLDRQDARLWSRDMIIEAEGLLTAASRFGTLGRFQCEAAIQSVHVQRPITGATNHAALLTLYRLLIAVYPSIGAQVGLAAVLVEGGKAGEALDVLEALPAASIDRYQPFWVAKAKALRALGEDGPAGHALARAIELTEARPVQAFLRALLAGNESVANN
jgi:RNA polymerase sigma-70 factor (ECF subfamily)